VSYQTALQAERKRRVEVAEGILRPPPPQMTSFAEFLRRFQRWWEPQRRPNTVRVADVAFRLACEVLGEMPLTAITGETLALLQTTWLHRGLTPSTINVYLTPIKHALKVAGQWGVLERIPTVRNLRTRQAPRRIISLAEETALLAAMPSRLALLTRFALHTGLRLGELMALRWDDLDFKAGLVQVGVDVAKSGRARQVPLNRTAREVLAHLPMHGRDSRIFGYKSIRTMFRRAVERAGLDLAITPHSCRHTFATRAIEAGVDLPTLQRWLGHATITMTAAYTHPSVEHERQAIHRLDAATRLPASLDQEGVS
jgi:integrase